MSLNKTQIMKKILLLLTLLSSFGSWVHAADSEAEALKLRQGAELFRDRCVFCHGNRGLGEGLLPLTIKGYASTNLREQRFVKDPSDKRLIRKIIVEGLPTEEGLFMPPWEGELEDENLEAIVAFIAFYYTQEQQANQLLDKVLQTVQANVGLGKRVFKTRCVLCHGERGEGDGKLARVIKNPPPFNLTLSQTSDEYLHKIISLGGESVSRSKRMPAWQGTLSEVEIQSIILYIKTLRRD